MNEASLPLSVEAYTRLLANVACRRGVRMAEILAELGIEEQDLHAAEVTLREQLAGVLQHRSGMAAMKFTSALGAELGLLGPIGATAPRRSSARSCPSRRRTRGARQRDAELAAAARDAITAPAQTARRRDASEKEITNRPPTLTRNPVERGIST